MDRIASLQARRAGILDQMEAITASVPETEDMSAEHLAQIEALRAEDDKVAGQIAALQDLERRRAAAAVPVTPITPAPTVAAKPAEKGLKFGRMVRLMAQASGNAFVAAQIAEAQGESGLFANQNMGSGAAGGFLVPEDVSSEIIELLRPASVVMRMQPVVVDMPNGNMTMNRVATGVAAGYIGEQQNLPATGVTFGEVILSAKKLAALIPISNDLMRSASTAVDRIVRDDAVTALGTRMDLAFIRGAGTAFTPKGLRNQHTATPFALTHVLTMTATPNLVNATTDLGRLELALLNNDVTMIRPGWLMAPRVAMWLRNLRDGNGNIAFPEMSQGLLRGKPFAETTQIPINLGGGTESEIYLADFAHVVVGEHMGIEIAMSTEAAYADAGGTVRAAFSRDETVMRAIAQHDIGLRHLPAVAILTGVTWGA
jgi:HK97 family phage major capsid protein